MATLLLLLVAVAVARVLVGGIPLVEARVPDGVAVDLVVNHKSM